MPKKRRRFCGTSRRALATAREVYLWPVYAREAVLGQEPLFFVAEAVALEWMEQGAAYAIRGKSLRLCLNLAPRVPQSLKMGSSILDGVVNRKAYALECLQAWKGVRFSPTMSIERLA